MGASNFGSVLCGSDLDALASRKLQSIMEVARLCADANNRLTASEKKETGQGPAILWSDLQQAGQIGDDQRLQSRRCVLTYCRPTTQLSTQSAA